jgi:AcrR family transcriptional regulator
MAKGYHHGDLRVALLASAAELLDEGGPEAVSLRECARRAGVSHAAPYRHFATKEALLLALAEEGFDGLAAAGDEAMRRVRDPRERLDAYGVAYVHFALEHPARFRLMFAGALGGASKHTGQGPPPGARAYALLSRCAPSSVTSTTWTRPRPRIGRFPMGSRC